VLLGALDIAVLGPALPAIRSQFGVSERSLAWLLNAYVLANLVGNPLLAKLSDRLGRRPVYLACVSLFAAGSLGAILSPTWGALVASRVVQGFGAGGIFPIASATVGDVVPMERRGRAMGLIGAMFGIAFLIGPILGGVCLLFSWHWIFLVNLPLSGLVLWSAARTLPVRNAVQGRPFDILGMALLTVMLLCLASGIGLLDTNHVLASLTGIPVLPLLAGAALAGVFFLWAERRAPDPIIHPMLLRIGGIRVSMALGLAIGIVQVGGTTFFPSFAAAAFHVPAHKASFMLLPLVLGITVGSPLVGRILDRIGARALTVPGLAVLVLCFAALALLPPSPSLFYGVSAALGLFMSTLQGPVRYTALHAAPVRERAAAQSLVTTCSSIGSVVAAAAMGALTASRPGLQGFSDAYLATAACLALACLAAVFLPRREDVHEAVDTEGSTQLA
jgi:MFS family permease